MNRLPLHGLGTDGATAGQVPTYDPAADAYVPADATGGGGGDFNPSSGRSPRLVPYGVKLRGANIVPRDSAGNPWATMYANWATKWDSIVKRQIDLAASVGANTIRMIGDVGGVHNGALTLDAYLDAYEQFVDYCTNLGLWVYACGGDTRHWQGATKEQALTILQAQASMLDTKRNVIGIDVSQEVSHTPAAWSGSTKHDFVSFLLDGVRQVTTLPLTCSVLEPDNSSTAQWSSATVTAFDDVVDFFDFHPYYDGMAPSHLDPVFAATDKPVLLGEYGGTTANLERHREAAVVSALPEVVGSFIWSITDNSTASDWALFDWSWGERTALTTIFRTVPDHQGALPGNAHTIQDEGVTLPARGRLNFVGDALTVTDDPTNDATTVTVTVPEPAVEPAAASGEVLMQDGVTGPPAPLENEDRSDWLYEG